MKSYKPFYICIISEILFWIIFRRTWWLWFNLETIFFNNIIERILIAIIRPIIWLIRDSKEKNTKYLKTGLIIIEIYIFLIIFVQNWSNLNKREFLILYLSVLWITKEVIYKRPKKWHNTFYVCLYSIISVIIILTWCLMRYRQPIDMNKIINNQNYKLITHLSETSNKYNSITLKNNYFTDYIDTNTWTTTHNIIKNMDYTLEYLSEIIDENNYIIIQDQLWNIIKIPPQSSFNFSTKQNQIQFTDKKRNIEYYDINQDFPNELEQYKNNYNTTIKNGILKNLPNMLRNNPKLQKISINYTKFLWTIFPFRYSNNLKILNEYIPYFTIYNKNDYESVNSKYSILKENESIGINNINWREKYRLF
jgi:hypothetical protein